jgi:hypothetical protein
MTLKLGDIQREMIGLDHTAEVFVLDAMTLELRKIANAQQRETDEGKKLLVLEIEMDEFEVARALKRSIEDKKRWEQAKKEKGKDIPKWLFKSGPL